MSPDITGDTVIIFPRHFIYYEGKTGTVPVVLVLAILCKTIWKTKRKRAVVSYQTAGSRLNLFNNKSSNRPRLPYLAYRGVLLITRICAQYELPCHSTDTDKDLSSLGVTFLFRLWMTPIIIFPRFQEYRGKLVMTIPCITIWTLIRFIRIHSCITYFPAIKYDYVTPLKEDKRKTYRCD